MLTPHTHFCSFTKSYMQCWLFHDVPWNISLRYNYYIWETSVVAKWFIIIVYCLNCCSFHAFYAYTELVLLAIGSHVFLCILCMFLCICMCLDRMAGMPCTRLQKVDSWKCSSSSPRRLQQGSMKEPTVATPCCTGQYRRVTVRWHATWLRRWRWTHRTGTRCVGWNSRRRCVQSTGSVCANCSMWQHKWWHLDMHVNW